MDDRLEFRVLGPLEVAAEGTALALGGPRQRAVLALLLLSPNRVVTRDRLVDAIWGDSPPASAANALQVAVHGLRKVLGRDRVRTHGTGYRLEVTPSELDVDRFVELTERARAEPPALAAQTLRQALALRRGVALADLADAPFVSVERERLEELQLTALERRIDADLELGRADELVPELEQLVAEHPYRERLRAQLMLALYRARRQAEALQAYRDARETLVDELGVEPSRHLQELEARILRQDPTLDITAAPHRPRTNIPTPGRPLVGRELELAGVTALVRSFPGRLVTLTGAGGTGKTRLALEAALELLESFPGGVFLVDLAPIRDHALVAPTIARVLGVTAADESDLIERIGAATGGRETLLVLDNVEHVLEAAPFVAGLLSRVSCLRVLATSRQPLRLTTEQEYRVPPLELPARDETSFDAISRSDAVALFASRARASEPAFELTGSNARAVAGICRALDGLPLALELAAARVRVLSPAALLDRLENRLELLEGGDRDLPDRQRALRATIDWSYDLLDPAERTLLARLAVFAGGWTLEAAESVCRATVPSLGSLVEKSLVQSSREAAGDPRFSMLETVREYALERLAASGETTAVRDRHAAYFAALAERVEPDLHTARALDEVASEHDNVRAALEHALSTRAPAVALRLCAVARFWYVRGYLGEGRTWIERALAREGGSEGRRARVLYWAATLAWTSGDHELAIARGRESLSLARAAGDELAELRALTALGLAHLGAGDLLASREFHAESLELARALGRERDIALSLSNIADIELVLGNHDAADTFAGEALDISRRLGDVEARGVAMLILGASSLERGRDADAVPMIVESVRCFRSVEFKDFLASALVALARARAPGDPAAAARLLGAAGALRAPLGPAQFPWERDWMERTVERIGDVLGEEATRAEEQAGASAPASVVDEIVS